MDTLRHMFKEPKALWTAIIIAVAFFLFYLWSIQNISFSEVNTTLGIFFVDNAGVKFMKTLAPFLWEPIGRINLTQSVSIFISPLNLLVDFSLSVLVFLNILVAVYSYFLGRVCNVKQRTAHGIFGLLPAFLTGFACCVPTFIIALGAVFSGFTVFFIEIRPFLIPVSIAIMVAGYWWSVRRVTPGLIKNYERRTGIRK